MASSYGRRGGSSSDAIKQVLRCYAERKAGHELLVEGWARMERAYHAAVDPSDMPAQWRSKLFPKYAMQVADTVAANLIDDRTAFTVKPRPRMDEPGEIQRHVQGARAHELLLSHQMDVDGYNRKKASFVFQNVIKGLSVAKIFWLTETQLRETEEAEVVYDDLGMPVGVQTIPRQKQDIVRDEPSFEVVRVEDFMWEEGAVELQRSPWIIHRVPATHDELKRLGDMGVYKNVDKLDLDPEGRAASAQDEFTPLDQELWQEERYKDRHELLEYWCKHDGALRCITVGDRKEVLADRPALFNHGDYPFVALTTRPNSFRIPGRSLVEAVMELQEYQWTLDNQTLDNIKLTNNAIFAYDETRVDPDKVADFFPGARWGVNGGDVREVVQQFVPDSSVVDRAMMVSARIKGDLQNITGGMPFMSGTESSTVDQTTATGVSIITSLAQRMLAFQKQFLVAAEEQVANQMISLNQQFVTVERIVPFIGKDGASAFQAIGPDILEGHYRVDAEPVNESLMRQERRAEGQAQLTMFLQLAPMAQAMGLPLNPKPWIDNYLKAYGYDDTEQFYTQQPQQPLGGQPGQPGQPGAGQPSQQPGAQGAGTTSPLAYGPNGPSNAQSMSGQEPLSRLMSMMGGANNSG